MNPSNSRIPTFNLDADAGKASPSTRNRIGKAVDTVLTRDIRGIIVPDGQWIDLEMGTAVSITQALGSSYTIAVDGRLVRLDGEDGDAIGQEKKGLLSEDLVNRPLNEETIRGILKTVFDPEIPVNVVDLGLVYGVKQPSPAEVWIDLTLTAPGCGMGEVLIQEIEMKLKKHPSIEKAVVNLVFDPPWNRSMLSTAAQLELGLL
jgi:probable FeS assembly SUF system protein SufT